MAAAHSTPWRGPEELLRVRRQLYLLGDCRDVADRRQGIDTITSWKLHGSLAFAIEASALLAEAMASHAEGAMSELALRGLYTAAVCRFVTRSCDDPFQQRRLNAVALEIGMPQSFVDLRNEATHGEMPELGILAKAAELAMTWLWAKYWVHLDEPTSSLWTDNAIGCPPQLVESSSVTPAETDPLKVSFVTLLKTYRNAKIVAVKAAGWEKDCDDDLARQASVSCLDLSQGQSGRLRLLAEIFGSEEKMLIPKNPSDSVQMQTAFRLWDPLLLMLTQGQPEFMASLLTVLTTLLVAPTGGDKHDELHRKGLWLWLRHLTFDAIWTRSGSGILHQADGTPEPSLPSNELRALLVSTCILSPTYWGWKLAKELIERADARFRYDWIPVYNASVPPELPGDSLVSIGNTQ